MPKYKVNVKWNKEKYDVEVDTDESPDVFRAQLFALTSVEPERQKIMIKGKAIKDSFDGIKLKDGATLLMMGTAGELPQAPVEKTVFVEDLSDAQLASASSLPPGLPNLGNTCYLNASVQCLRAIPELKDAVTRFPARDPSSLSAGLSMLFKILDSARDSTQIALATNAFVQTLRRTYPRFAEMREGHYSQQDANEAFGELVRTMQQNVPGVTATGDRAEGAPSVIEQFMGVRQEVTLKCAEAPEEPATVAEEKALQLSCHIDKGVGYIMAGIKQSMNDSITKNSPTLGRDAEYVKETKLTRLPAYLCVNFVRFFFKREKAVNCKINKEVKFPFKFDVFELCSDSLKEKLKPMRDHFAAYADAAAEAEAAGSRVGKSKKAVAKKDSAMEDDVEYCPTSFEDDVGSNNSGYYELVAVLSHRGRSSDSGHYVAWCRSKPDEWLIYDDDSVNVVPTDDILKLSGSGGADWHTAYTLVFAPARVPKELPKIEAAKEVDEEAAKAEAAAVMKAMEEGA